MTHWGEWSREAVALMQRRNDEWTARYSLAGEPYRWDLDSATLRFQRQHDWLVASICLVGTTSQLQRTFLWGWANDTLPRAVTDCLDVVRRFGEANDLPLLTEPELAGGRPEGLEVLAIAGRILDAEGAFVHEDGDVTYFFALRDFRVEQPGS